jgi:AraC-like DNA-binding protein
MILKCKFKPVLVKSLWEISHRGKKRNYYKEAHAHDPKATEMIFTDYGKTKVTIKEKTYIINPGECIFIKGGVPHTVEGAEGAPFDFLNIMFRGKIPSFLFEKVLTVNRKGFELLTILKQESVTEQPYGSEVIASCLTMFLAYLIRQVEGFVPSGQPESANYKHYPSDIVNRALKVIADQYSRPLDMSMLCKAVGIGESRLRQLIRIETGQNFSTLLHKQRVAAAKHLLNEGIYSLSEISSAVGYIHPPFFFKVFKRITGMTPGAYAVSLGEPTNLD